MHKTNYSACFQKSVLMDHHVLYECNELSLSVNHQPPSKSTKVQIQYSILIINNLRWDKWRPDFVRKVITTFCNACLTRVQSCQMNRTAFSHNDKQVVLLSVLDVIGEFYLGKLRNTLWNCQVRETADNWEGRLVNKQGSYTTKHLVDVLSRASAAAGVSAARHLLQRSSVLPPLPSAPLRSSSGVFTPSVWIQTCILAEALVWIYSNRPHAPPKVNLMSLFLLLW